MRQGILKHELFYFSFAFALGSFTAMSSPTLSYQTCRITKNNSREFQCVHKDIIISSHG